MHADLPMLDPGSWVNQVMPALGGQHGGMGRWIGEGWIQYLGQILGQIILRLLSLSWPIVCGPLSIVPAKALSGPVRVAGALHGVGGQMSLYSELCHSHVLAGYIWSVTPTIHVARLIFRLLGLPFAILLQLCSSWVQQ